MTGFGVPIRPTRHRLSAALAISAFAVAALLAVFGSLIEFSARVAAPEAAHATRLDVVIARREAQPAPVSPGRGGTATPPAGTPAVTAEVAARPPPVVPVPAPLPDPPARDWQAIAEATARSSVDDWFRNRESHAALWRETQSVMFRPGPDFVATDEEPLLRDFRFKPEIHVLGLGVTIGSCFIGLPLLGVPIEQRSVAINLFVCAREPDKSG